MRDIEPTISLEGLYMVKFNPESPWSKGLRGGNDYKPAIIYKYEGPTSPDIPRLNVEWLNGYGSAVVPPEAILVKQFN